MYKWLIVGCAVGFGLGIIFISMLFEMALSPFGNPLTVDYTTWDWNAQTNTWKLIGIMWILAGMVALYIIYKAQEKAKPSSKLSLAGIEQEISDVKARIKELKTMIEHGRGQPPNRELIEFTNETFSSPTPQRQRKHNRRNSQRNITRRNILLQTTRNNHNHEIL